MSCRGAGSPDRHRGPHDVSNPGTLRERGSWWLDVVARSSRDVRVEQAVPNPTHCFSIHGRCPYFAGPPQTCIDRIELAPAAEVWIASGRVLENPYRSSDSGWPSPAAACVTVANLNARPS